MRRELCESSNKRASKCGVAEHFREERFLGRETSSISSARAEHLPAHSHEMVGANVDDKGKQTDNTPCQDADEPPPNILPVERRSEVGVRLRRLRDEACARVV